MFNQKSHLFLSRQTRARAARGCQANVCAGPATRSCRQRPHVPRAAPGRARRRRLLRPETRASRRRGDQRCQSLQPAARASPTALEGAAGGGAARSPRRCLRAPDSPGARGNGAAESPQRTPTPPTHTADPLSHTHTHPCAHTQHAHARAHAAAHTRTAHTHAQPTSAHPCSHTQVHTCAFTLTSAHSYMPLTHASHAHAHLYAKINTPHLHTRAHTRVYTHTRPQLIPTHTHTSMHVCSRTKHTCLCPHTRP